MDAQTLLDQPACRHVVGLAIGQRARPVQRLDGLGRVVAFIGRNFGPERETARVRLLELFDVVGTSDPRVAKARQNLARVLF